MELQELEFAELSGLFSVTFDEEKENLVRVSREFELSKFELTE